MNRLTIVAFGLIIAAFLVTSSVYIVDEREKALVLQFGEVKVVEDTPGIKFKIPFIQEVVYYDDRILSLDTIPLQVTFKDKRRLVVDAFTRYQIVDVVQFRRAVGSGGVRSAEDRLELIVNSSLREVFGTVNTGDVLSADRSSLMKRIQDDAFGEFDNLGLAIVDVRIKRADLPPENLAETYSRMQAEREREAADERARGNEAAQIVRAEADKTAVELVSEAQRDSDIIRGEADGARNAIFAEAYSKDPDFFAFYRSLAAYEASLQGNNTTLVLSPDNEFFDFLKSDGLE